MEAYKFLLIAVILVGSCDAAFKKYKRSPMPHEGDDAAAKTKSAQPAWKAVDTEKSFTVSVDDNIKHANQFRTETWHPNGRVEGEYAAPARDGKWLKTQYMADDKGFHIISQKLVDEQDLNKPSSGAAQDHTASIQTNVNGKDVAYTVKEDDLKKAQDSNKKSGL